MVWFMQFEIVGMWDVDLHLILDDVDRKGTMEGVANGWIQWIKLIIIVIPMLYARMQMESYLQ
jgi:hypothetical protein